jgi:hypothetical protein
MLQDLAALAPPAIVCVGFVVGAWVLIRRELAPRRRLREERAEEEARAEEESPSGSGHPADGTLGKNLYIRTSAI